MERLTTNKPVSEMNMVELAYNSCYAKDGKAMFRDFDIDMDARKLAIDLLGGFAMTPNEFTDDEDFDETMLDNLQYGFGNMTGFISVFYRNLWAMVDMREKLKYYEDLDEQGLLLRLPCKVGDTVYYPEKMYNFIYSVKISQIIIGELKSVQFNGAFFNADGDVEMEFEFDQDDFGKTVFSTKEQALAEMQKAEV